MGEEIAVIFLINNGFSIIERNYTKKIGEIDIVAEKGSQLYFIEVKTRRETVQLSNSDCYYSDAWERTRYPINAFENITPEKIRKLRKTIAYYLAERSVSRETLLNLSGLAIYLDQNDVPIQVDFIENLLGT